MPNPAPAADCLELMRVFRYAAHLVTNMSNDASNPCLDERGA